MQDNKNSHMNEEPNDITEQNPEPQISENLSTDGQLQELLTEPKVAPSDLNPKKKKWTKRIRIILETVCVLLLVFSILAYSDVVKQANINVKEHNELLAEYNETAEEYNSLSTKYDSYKDKMKPYEEMEVAEAEAKRIEAEKVAADKKAADEKAAADKKAADEKAAADAAAAKAAEEARGYETGISYDQLARTPGDFKGQKVKFYGKVVQVMEGTGVVQIRLAVDDNYDTILLGEYLPSIVASRILDDDYITIYGTSTGTISYQSTMGGTITIPGISIDKIEM